MTKSPLAIIYKVKNNDYSCQIFYQYIVTLYFKLRKNIFKYIPHIFTFYNKFCKNIFKYILNK